MYFTKEIQDAYDYLLHIESGANKAQYAYAVVPQNLPVSEWARYLSHGDDDGNGTSPLSTFQHNVAVVYDALTNLENIQGVYTEEEFREKFKHL